MRRLTTALAATVLLAVAAVGASTPAPFDGAWTTVVACSASAGALPYTYEFTSTVSQGVLHGERGIKDAPGWLRVDGHISTDGSAALAAHGLVGREWAATGHLPPGTPYRYRIEAKFSGDSGSGERVSGRSCKISFSKSAQ
ncbi:MAG TPA: hypothetical protein VNX02_12425 [Steroidobacteraceae bacterium]|jgi:hypothetical protein|nr:hypothetical protein [Steroidobacteraceae bacterium]